MFVPVLTLCMIAAVMGAVPTKTKVTAAIKDTNVEGLEGFNVNLVAPFKVQDYVVGFRYALGNLKKLPESLFAKKSFDVPTVGGVATVESNFFFDDNNLNVAANWKNDDLGLSVGAEGDLKRKLKSVDISKSLNIQDKKLSLSAVYDVLKQKLSSSASLAVDNTKLKIDVDSEKKDPLVTLSHALDESNELSPSVRVKSGDLSVGYKRSWKGGSILSTFFPGDKVTFEWKDNGSNGAWTSKASVPLDDLTKTKVTLGHEWTY